MSESTAPLPETSRRIDELITDHRLDRNDVLDAKTLSERTGIPAHTVQTLLEGTEFAEDDVDTRARTRLQFLHETHRAPDGRPYEFKDIADAIGISEVWARALLTGKKVPSMKHGHALTQFFDVPEGFLTAKATDALNRELGPILQILQGATDPLNQVMTSHGLVTIAQRGTRSLTQRQKSAIASMLDVVLDEGTGR